MTAGLVEKRSKGEVEDKDRQRTCGLKAESAKRYRDDRFISFYFHRACIYLLASHHLFVLYAKSLLES